MRYALRVLAPTIVLVLFLAPAWTATAGSRTELAGMDDALAAALRGAEGPIPVVIRYHEPPTASDAQALLARGFVGPLLRFQVVPAVAAAGPASAVADVLRDPRVAFVELDAAMPYHTDRAKVVGRAIDAWTASWKDALGEVHTGGITGRGIRVAVVDSGVDATHPDLLWAPLANAAGMQATTAFNFKVVGRDSVGATALPNSATGGFLEANVLGIDMADTDTTGGHGTHVAGTVAGNGFASDGKYRGAAPGAQLVGYGAGETLIISSGLAAFDHIHKHHEELGIRVVTNSWGGPGDWQPNSAITIAARRLVNEDGLVVLFSAGNDGGDGSTIQTSTWANIPEVISVANYYDRVGWLDSSSSRGLRSEEHTWPDLAAPGTQIISTAAAGKPVTFVCTGQDAAIDELDDGPEPTVVPVPAPVTSEQEVDGEPVVIGPYASCTGTSMATPFVAGVAALVLEANPALDPFSVREILRHTASMPRGRSYEVDGFAVGHGVVDAVEAVAVALRMRDGASLHEALASAYVDVSGATALLNFQAHERLVLDAPAAGSNVSGPALEVEGRFVPGPRTDQTVPLQPVAGTVPPVDAILSVYQPTLAGVNPCAGVGGCAIGGVEVDLGSRNMVAQREDVVLTADTQVRHLVYKDGALYATPDTVFGLDADGEGRADAFWTPPTNDPGDYAFAAEILVGDAWEEYGREAVLYFPGLAPPMRAAGGTVVLSEGFEGGAPGWTTRQDSGLGDAQPTAWTFLREGEGLTMAGAHGGRGFAYVGVAETAQAAAIVYTDLADASLVSPEVDLRDAALAELRFWRAGASETDRDILATYVESDGVLTEVDAASGTLLDSDTGWEEVVVPLDAYVGGTVRVHFRFTSDAVSTSPNVGGWSVDDVKIAVTTAEVPFVTAALAADATHGVGGLVTTFTYAAVSNVPIASFALDFGDGSAPHVASVAGSVAHAYAPGQLLATLTVTAADVVSVATLAIDVAPTGIVQVRIADRSWQDAGVVAPGLVSPFAATLDLAGLSGPQTVEARLFDASGALTPLTASAFVHVSGA